MSKITGMVAVGTNEKCPYCDDIMTKEINISKHLTDNHRRNLVEALFGNTDEEYLEQNKYSNFGNDEEDND